MDMDLNDGKATITDAGVLLLDGDVGLTGTRITKIWADDLTVTNAINGGVTGNAGTVSTITGLAPDTATTAAAQANITSLGTLTGLSVDGAVTINESGVDVDLRVEAVGVTHALFVDGANGNVGVGLAPTVNMTGLSIEAGSLTIKETTTPTADADYGKIYTKSDNLLYFQDGAGVEHPMATKAYAVQTITQPSTDTLTTAKIVNTKISNYGQTVANIQTLPTLTADVNFIGMVSSASVGALSFKAGPTDRIQLNGTWLDDGDKVTNSAPAVGDYITGFSIQVGATSYDLIMRTGVGTWIDGDA